MRTIESIKVTTSEYWKTPITTEKEVKGYFRLLWKDLGLSFHPDDPFELFIDDNGERVFDDEAAAILDTRMDECFEVCEKANVDIYSIGMDGYTSKVIFD